MSAQEISGTTLNWDGSTPVLVDDIQTLWRVERGHVDLFAVEVHQGEPRGKRRFLQRVPAGRVIFGMGSADYGVGVLAVGVLGTQVVRAGHDALAGTDSKRLAEWVDAWVSGLSDACAEVYSNWPEQVAPEAGSIQLPAGAALYGHSRRLAWVHTEQSTLRWLGMEASGPMKGPLPVMGRSFVIADAAAELHCRDTASLIDAGGLWPALDQMHDLVLQRLASIRRQRDQEVGQRTRERDRLNQAFLNAGLGHLANAIDRRFVAPAAGDSSGDVLQTMLGVIAGHMGFSLKMPPDEVTEGEELAAIARASGLRYRQVVLRDDWWRRDNGPLLAFDDSGAPVALIPSGAGHYQWFDAAGRGRKLSAAGASSLESRAYQFYRPFPDEPLGLVGFLRFGLRGLTLDMRTLATMGVAAGVLALVMPIGTGLIVDEVLPRAALDQLWQIAGALLIAILAMTGFRFVQSVAFLRMEGRLDWVLQAAVFDRLLKLPAAFFKQFSSGDLGDRVLGIQTMRSMLSSVVSGTLLTALFSLFSLALLFAYSLKLALIAVVLATLAASVTLALSAAFLHFERLRLADQGHVEGLVLQLIRGVTKLRVAAAEERALGRWATHFASQKRHRVKAHRWGNWLDVFHGVFPIISAMVIYSAISSWLMSENSLSAGEYLAFNAAYLQFMGAITGLAMTMTRLLAAVPLYERVKPIFQALPESTVGRRAPGPLDGGIELSSVAFRYNPEMPWVLDELSLSIRAGEFVAIVGPSGCGKSTLLRLLLGFEQAERGEVFYDGKALSTLDVSAVRSQIGVVLQNGKIQSGSLFENIVGNTNLTLEDAERVARLVGLDRDIEAMPMGMHTMLMAGGGTLSGGQRQRLLIARALVRQPRMLFLDEATSALDNRTQAIVTETLESLNTTRLVIAHRLSTIRRVDRIIVLDKGRVVESGSYDQLMGAEGAFAQLAKRQLL